MDTTKGKSMFAKEYFWRDLMTACGLFVIVLTIGIGAFLVYKGSGTFLTYGHTLWEFLGSAQWAPADNSDGGGTVGALIFVVGSLCTCGLALLIAAPFPWAQPFLSQTFLQNSEKNFTVRSWRSLPESHL